MKTVLRKRNPFFTDLFDEFWGRDFAPASTRLNTPAVNIKETETGFVLDIVAPGYSKEDVSINLEENVLTIASEKQAETSDKTETYTRKEFQYSSFKRSFTLPDSVNQNDVKATFKNGILSIALPKKEEALPKPPKQIEIA